MNQPNYHIELLDKHVSFDGEQRFYRDYAQSLEKDIELAIYVPVSALEGKHCAVVYYLPDIEESARSTANQSDYQRYANRYDVILVIPDLFGDYSGNLTDRLRRFAHERAAINTYILESLPLVIEHHFRVYEACSMMGYGFGGTLALSLALSYSQSFRSVSALAPWLGFYHNPYFKDLMDDDCQLSVDIDPLNWFEQYPHERCVPMWIDQGLDDALIGKLIHLDTFEEACGNRKDAEHIIINRHERYDHSFYFVHSHVREHFVFHNEPYDE